MENIAAVYCWMIASFLSLIGMIRLLLMNALDQVSIILLLAGVLFLALSYISSRWRMEDRK